LPRSPKPLAMQKVVGSNPISRLPSNPLHGPSGPLRPLAIDGLVLYDIDDESDRNPDERAFPFLPTMDPAEFLVRDFAVLEVPAIVYRAVGK
jgi:hypothetical protein